MPDLTPRCPHCNNLTVMGSVAERLVAVCTHCDNGFAVAGTTHPQVMNYPAQQVTRQQLDNATTKVFNHLTHVATQKQEGLLEKEGSLPEDQEAWTDDHHKIAAELRSQRMVYAGVLQGANSFRDLLSKSLGLSGTTLGVSAAPAPAADTAT